VIGMSIAEQPGPSAKRKASVEKRDGGTQGTSPWSWSNKPKTVVGFARAREPCPRKRMSQDYGLPSSLH
jgi:hypothetical protein